MKLLKYLFVCIFISFSSSAFSSGVDFSLDSVTIPKSVSFIYTQVFNKPFMISPDVLVDTRQVSFHITPDLDAKDFYVRYLNNMGIGVSTKKGVDYIYKLKVVEPITPKYTFTYEPRYRSVSYLSGVLSSIVEGSFGRQSSSNSYVGGSVASVSSTSSSSSGFGNANDVLVFYGTASDIRRIKEVLPNLDTPTSEVYVGGYVYQVQTSSRNGSGLALAAKLLNQHFQLQIGGSSDAGMDNFIKFSSGNLNALVELFNTDSRFTVVSSPSLRASNGSKASFSVGEDVPVLGNVSYNGDSSVQSVDYRSSGVIFNVQPLIRKDSIDLHIEQELSNFARTDTGVNNSPTLIKRQIETDVSVNDGDIILIGGLADNKDTNANTGLSFMPHWFKTNSDEKTKTDIVIVLQAKRVKR